MHVRKMIFVSAFLLLHCSCLYLAKAFSAIPSNTETAIALLLNGELDEDRRRDILCRIQRDHQTDRQASSVSGLAMEQRICPSTSSSKKHNILQTPEFDWITVEQHKYRLALASCEPLLTHDECNTIRNEATKYWGTNHGRSSSRFTYQRKGNYEVHTSELGPTVVSLVNEILLQQVYPLVRKAFSEKSTISPFCVYDSLVIRYNATEATNGAAGQPLHRDLGMYTLNILLNDPFEFEGGGTFFENQLLANDHQQYRPLQPRGKGYSLMHRSSERHAGASITTGIRDILVIFMMPTEEPLYTPRLKQCRKFCEQEQHDKAAQIRCQISHHLIAIERDPSDGEAFQYLGTALLQYANYTDTADLKSLCLEAAKDCLVQASQLTPCDARVYNNLGLVLSRLDVPTDAVEHAYRRSYQLLEACDTVGCDVESTFDGLQLNYGLFISNQDRFQEAANILLRVASKKENIEKSYGQVIDDAHRLYQFCLQQEERSKE